MELHLLAGQDAAACIEHGQEAVQIACETQAAVKEEPCMLCYAEDFILRREEISPASVGAVHDFWCPRGTGTQHAEDILFLMCLRRDACRLAGTSAFRQVQESLQGILAEDVFLFFRGKAMVQENGPGAFFLQSKKSCCLTEKIIGKHQHIACQIRRQCICQSVCVFQHVLIAQACFIHAEEKVVGVLLCMRG